MTNFLKAIQEHRKKNEESKHQDNENVIQPLKSKKSAQNNPYFKDIETQINAKKEIEDMRQTIRDTEIHPPNLPNLENLTNLPVSPKKSQKHPILSKTKLQKSSSDNHLEKEKPKLKNPLYKSGSKYHQDKRNQNFQDSNSSEKSSQSSESSIYIISPPPSSDYSVFSSSSQFSDVDNLPKVPDPKFDGKMNPEIPSKISKDSIPKPLQQSSKIEKKPPKIPQLDFSKLSHPPNPEHKQPIAPKPENSENVANPNKIVRKNQPKNASNQNKFPPKVIRNGQH